MSTNTADISKLRAQTGAGVLDCKKAIEETGGNYQGAVDWLRQKGAAKAAKRADKVAAEGMVASYIHAGGKIGVLVEVNCETDFVAKNEQFQNLTHDIAMHIAAAAPRYLSKEDVPIDELNRERKIYRQQLKSENKPAEIVEKIIAGKLDKFYSEICLLQQPFVKDEEQNIATLLIGKTGEIGEKITIRRFARYELGEGIEKQKSNFVAEVQGQLGE